MPATTMTSEPSGELFLGSRHDGPATRLTWHHKLDEVVMSLWQRGVCAGTFQLPRDEAPAFVESLIEGLAPTRGAGPATAPGRLRTQFAG